MEGQQNMLPCPQVYYYTHTQTIPCLHQPLLHFYRIKSLFSATLFWQTAFYQSITSETDQTTHGGYSSEDQIRFDQTQGEMKNMHFYFVLAAASTLHILSFEIAATIAVKPLFPNEGTLNFMIPYHYC